MKKVIVIKIGSSTVQKLGEKKIVEWVSKIKKKYSNVILVSSGAVSEGRQILQDANINDKKFSKKELSAIGQGELYSEYTKFFRKKGIQTAQILVTGKVQAETIKNLLNHNILPIVNGNDPDESKDLFYEDNDTLAGDILLALDKKGVAILLTDIDGVYDKNPKEKDALKIKELKSISKKLLENSKSVGSSAGTGGMYTKLKMAKKILKYNQEMYISDDFIDVENFLNGKGWKGTVIKK